MKLRKCIFRFTVTFPCPILSRATFQLIDHGSENRQRHLEERKKSVQCQLIEKFKIVYLPRTSVVKRRMVTLRRTKESLIECQLADVSEHFYFLKINSAETSDISLLEGTLCTDLTWLKFLLYELLLDLQRV